jgi:hypothetical protein
LTRIYLDSAISPRTPDPPLNAASSTRDTFCCQTKPSIDHPVVESENEADDPSAPHHPSSALDIEKFEHVKQTLSSASNIAEQTESGHEVQIVNQVDALLKEMRTDLFKFDPSSDQIIALIDKCKEKDTETLMQITCLIVEKAIDHDYWLDRYASLCRKIKLQIHSQVQDKEIWDAEDKPMAGSRLFCEYLLRVVENELKIKRPIMPNWGSMAPKDYYAASKAKSQSMNIVKFSGELFKAGMLPKLTMHALIKKLLANPGKPDEHDIDRLHKLLRIAGPCLDEPQTRDQMDTYFSRIRDMTNSTDHCSLSYHIRLSLCVSSVLYFV